MPCEADLNRLYHPASLSSGVLLGSTNGKHQQKIIEGRKEGLECLLAQLSPCWAWFGIGYVRLLKAIAFLRQLSVLE